MIKLQSDNSIVREVAAADVTIDNDDVDGPTVTIPFSGLDSEVGYYVIAPDGFVTDIAGNDWVSVYTLTTSWQFTSSDFVKPTVAQSIDLSTPPAATDNILLTFSELVDLVGVPTLAGLSGGDEDDWFPYIGLEQNNTVLAFTATWSPNVITIDPDANLDPNTTYTVVIRPDVIEDAETASETPDGGNKLSATELRLDVTTGDFGGAGTIALSPANGTSNVSQNVTPTIVFSQAIQDDDATAIELADLEAAVTFQTNPGGVDVAHTASWDAATFTLTLTPAAALDSEQAYDLDFDHTAIEDVHEQAFADPTASTFTVIDYIVPTATLSHTGTVDDKLSTDNLTITISEAVTIDGTTITNTNVDALVVFKKDNADGENLLFDATIAGNIITIDPTADLVVDQVYYYGIGAGSVNDKPGGTNDIADSFTTFTFAPAAPDVLEVAEGGLDPADEATGIQVDGDGNLKATITFAEAVKANPVTPTPNTAKLYEKVGDVLVSTVTIGAGDFVGSQINYYFPGCRFT